jgi:hypothetical protein
VADDEILEDEEPEVRVGAARIAVRAVKRGGSLPGSD